VAAAHEAHLDSTVRVIVNRAVNELVQNEVRSEFGVRASQQIKIERGGDSFRVIVGAMQKLAPFLQINSDQQAVIGFAQARDAAEKGGCLRRLKVPNRRAGKKNHRAFWSSRGRRQNELLIVIGAEWKDFERKIIAV